MTLRKISIITPSLDRKDMLEEVIQNVLAQEYSNFEHIVVDGDSMDGTQDMVGKYPHVHFICGPDSGMYDALNKGLDVSSGEIIGFLNTDDFYADHIFEDVAAAFNDETVMAVAGNAVVFNESLEGKMNIIERYSPEDNTLLECSTIGSNFFNAWFFRKSVFEQIGTFNSEYQIAGDRELMLRFKLNNLRYIAMNRLIYQYRQHAGSLTFDATNQKREWGARENLRMTSIYLRDDTLSPQAREFLIKLRTRETIDLSMRMIWARDFKKGVYYFLGGIEYDVFWPLQFIWRAILTTVKWLRKNTKSHASRKIR